MKNVNPLISVIIPVYNVEQFLEKCLKSVLSQTYKNIEIILVNDGSSDNSGKICEEFSRKYSCIKYVDKKNEGVSKARQTGFLNSSGEWIVFVDSDDEIPADAIEKLIREVDANSDLDIVIGGYLYIPYSKFQLYYKRKSVDGDELNLLYLKRKVHTGPVAKLFRKKIVPEDAFDIPPEIKMGEDFIMNVRIARRAQKVQIVPDNVYNYYVRSNSVCKTFTWTAKYVKEFEKILYQSLGDIFLKRHQVWTLKNKFSHRVEIVKSLIKRFLNKA